MKRGGLLGMTHNIIQVLRYYIDYQHIYFTIYMDTITYII